MKIDTLEEAHKKCKEYESAGKIVGSYIRTFICISDTGNKGKTTTTNEVINILGGYPTATVLLHTNHMRQQQTEQFIVRIGNQTIGVDCVGDPGTNFPRRIDSLGAYPCDAIICTARSSGETLNAAKNTAIRYGMLFIKTSTYQHDELPAVEPIFNRYKAEHIIDLLRRRRHLP